MRDRLAHLREFFMRSRRAFVRMHQPAEFEELLLAQIVVDVALGDAPLWPCSAHVREFDAGLFGGAPRERRGSKLVPIVGVVGFEVLFLAMRRWHRNFS